MRRLARAAVPLVALSLLGCAAPAPVPTPRAPQTAPSDAAALSNPDRQHPGLVHVDLPGMAPAPADYLAQTVAWSRCGDLECADVLAPEDHDAPQAGAITLHLVRRPARSGSKGAVLVNPGGPGEPAEGLVSSARWKQLPDRDIVGWDPRGTGGSTPVRCVADPDAPQPEVDRALDVDISPDDDAEYEALVASNRQEALNCARYSGTYLRHLGADQTVRDMDLVRQLLGQERLDYVGYSYGTWLGAVYATRFPDKVGRMVLDSPVNVTTDTTTAQSAGFERAFGLFSTWAARRGRLGHSADQVRDKVRGLLESLDATPLPAGSRRLTQAGGVMGVAALLYGEESEWQSLETVLLEALRGDGTRLLTMADFMNGRDADGSYETSYYAFRPLLCADEPDAGLAAAREQWARDRAAAPLFGALFGPGVMCETWVVDAQRTEVAAPRAAPIVVVGSTGDAATPYEYARWMVDALGSAVLVTWDGPGHGSYGNGNRCLDRAVSGYLRNGTVPADGTTCRP